LRDLKHRNMSNYKIFEELDNLKNDYVNNQIQIVDGLYFSQYRTIKMCEFYSNSTYLKSRVSRFGDKIDTKNKDGLGRDKPFYNIVNFRVTVSKTATELDIKDINIVADNESDWIRAMFLNKEVYKWMKESNFSLTLNKMGYTRAKYGGYVVKKTIEENKKGKDVLKIDVVEWKNLFTNQVDIMKNPIVELHYMSPVTIKSKDGVWYNVDDVLKANKKAKERSSNIHVYEITGEFPKSLYLEAEGKESNDTDQFEFSLQKYFIAEVEGQKFKLYCEELKGDITDTYGYLPWETMSGRDLGKGVIEDSEEAQVWTNDAVINENNAMNLAGRVGIKTNSKKLGNNILEHDHGKIYELANGEDMNSFNLAPSALGNFQNQIDKWKVQADNVTSSFESATGEQPPSGTPYSTTALLNSVATKPFDYRREEWGIHLTEIFENWVVPHIISNLYKGHTLRSEYSDDELKIIDESIHTKNHNSFAKELALMGKLPSQEEVIGVQTSVDGELQKYNKTRFIEFTKGYFDNVKAGVSIITSGEQKNKSAVMQSLSTVLDTVIKSYNPNTGKFGVLEDPKLSKIFGTIVEMSQSGISPISLGLGGSPKSMAPTAPAPSQEQPSPVQAESSEPLKSY